MKKIIKSKFFTLCGASLMYVIVVLSLLIDGITVLSSGSHIVLQHWYPIDDNTVYMYFYATFGAVIAEVIALPKIKKMIKDCWN